MQTIVELPEFFNRADRLLTPDEKVGVINFLASHPQSGELIQGTGGIRKLPWSAKGKGKSGGIRVIYYFHSDAVPLFLLTVFGKAERANISKAERNELAKLSQNLLKHYGG